MAGSCGVPFGSVLSLLAQVGGAADCLPSAFTSGESLAGRRLIRPGPSQTIIAQTEESVGVKAFTSASRDLGTVVSREGGEGGIRVRCLASVIVMWRLWIWIRWERGFWPSYVFSLWCMYKWFSFLALLSSNSLWSLPHSPLIRVIVVQRYHITLPRFIQTTPSESLSFFSPSIFDMMRGTWLLYCFFGFFFTVFILQI